MRYAAYVRISSDEQIGNYSIDAQKRAIETWVISNGGIISLAVPVGNYTLNLMLDISIIVLMVIAAIVAAGMIVGNALLGPSKTNPSKLEPFECGCRPSSDPKEAGRRRFSVKFYLIAILFLLFDIETVMLYPWAVVYDDFTAQGLAMLMFVEMFIFVGVLAIGLWYLWKKGGLEWD